MQNILTRVHVYSQRAFSDAEVMSIVRKLCPQALTTFPKPKITYSCLSAWPESVPAYLVARFYSAGFNDSDFQADKVRFEEGTAWGSEICVVSISHPKGSDLLL